MQMNPDPPVKRGQQEIPFCEASEGGAGVLRQVVEDPSVVPGLARRTLELCHFDPVTPSVKRIARYSWRNIP